MKKYWKELVYGISFVLIFGGLVFWIAITTDLNPLILIIGVSVLMIGLITFIYKIITQ